MSDIFRSTQVPLVTRLRFPAKPRAWNKLRSAVHNNCHISSIYSQYRESNMAALSISKRAVSLFKRPFLPVGESFKSARALSITSNKSKFFGQESVGKATDAHSKLLTEKDTLYEFECKVLFIRKRLHSI